MERLTKEQARRFMLLKNGLIGRRRYKGIEGMIQFLRESGCVAIDQNCTCGTSQELTLLSRIDGLRTEDYHQAMFSQDLIREYYDKGPSLILTEDMEYFSHIRKQYRLFVSSRQSVSSAAKEVLQLLRQNGHLTSLENPFTENPSLFRTVLEALYYSGAIRMVDSCGNVKTYALCETEEEKESPFPGVRERCQWQILRRINGTGMLWNMQSEVFPPTEGIGAAARQEAFQDLEAMGLIRPVHVDGITMPLYISVEDEKYLAEARKELSDKCVRILPSMDNLLWDRKLISILFGFSCRDNINAYAFPVLYGDTFAGKINLQVQDHILYVNHYSAEPHAPDSNRFWWAVQDELNRICRYYGLHKLIWKEGW